MCTFLLSSTGCGTLWLLGKMANSNESQMESIEGEVETRASIEGDEDSIIDNPTLESITETEVVSEVETTEAASEVETEDDSPNTYENNQYYEIVETGAYQNIIGSTIVIQKLLAKKNVSISSTVIAMGADGTVLDKATDDITLTEGQYNYFRYSFENDVSGAASFQKSANPKNDSFMTGERDAVKLVQYNRSGDDLFLTLEQTGEEVSPFAKFKLLLYKNDEIVGDENGYFSVYAENLNGKGSTDVASISVYGEDFDRIEYCYEP